MAAALALLDGKLGDIRFTITEEDWRLAGIVRAVSDRTRSRIVHELQKAEVRRNRARGEADADRAIIVNDRVAEEAEKRAGRAIMRKVDREGGWVVKSELRGSLESPLRAYFEPVAAALIEAGQLEERPTEASHRRHQGTEYRRAP